MGGDPTPVHCAECSSESPAGFRFCGNCGAELPKRCAKCGFASPPGFRFCGECGQDLGAAPEAAGETAVETKPFEAEGDAERRQLTVVFCDLAGSTELSERLDPEDLRELVLRYQAVCVEELEPYGGHVAQYLGDGVLIYFGYPTAHEDDARRAVHASLGIQSGIERLNRQLESETGTRIGVRIGIHSGAVVTGDVGSGETVEQLAMGRTPNIAARLQGLAEPGAVVVSDATARLLGEHFELDSLGKHSLKGVSRPAEVHRVVRARRTAVGRKEKAPLIGREREQAFLRQTLELSDRGKSQTVLLSAEAGVGKTRLLEAFRGQVGESGYRWLVVQASAYHRSSAYYPLLECLRNALVCENGGSAEEMQAQAEAALASHPTLEERTVSLLLSLFDFAPSESDPLANATPSHRKALTQEALMALMTALAQEQTLILLVEDLHWMDPSSLEFLQAVLDTPPVERSLSLFTFRPDFEPPFRLGAGVTRLALDRLAREEVESLIRKLAGGRALPRKVLDQLVERADGVPLFVEELTRAVVESDWLDRWEQGDQRLGIPDTIRGLLTARLDQLGKVKQLAQIASVIGREFSVEALAAVLERDPDSVRRAIRPLVEADIISRQRGARYGFHHALIQEAAYDSLLRRTRKGYHRRIARTLAERFPEEAEARPEGLARHLTEAGLVEEAVPQWLSAGRRDLQRSANAEAIEHLSTGLGLVAEQPQGEGRDQLELAMITMIGTALSATRGYTATEVAQVYARAEAICERLGDSDTTFWALRVISSFYVVSGRYDRVQEIGERLYRAARLSDDPSLAMEAHLATGVGHYYLGQLESARDCFESGLALDTPGRQPTSINFTGAETKVMTLAHLGWTLWLLGRPDAALESCREATATARELGHPMTLSFARFYSGWLHHHRGEVEPATECVTEVLEISERYGFFLSAHTEMLEGWTLTQVEGRRAEGVAKVEKGYEDLCATGQMLARTHYSSLLAATQIDAELFDEAGIRLDEAEEMAERCNERFWLPEILRLRAELLGHSGKQQGEAADERRRLLERAMTLARESGARSLELRVTTDLAALLARDGESRRGREMLEEIHGSLGEGLGTADSRRASDLLGTLTVEGGIRHVR